MSIKSPSADRIWFCKRWMPGAAISGLRNGRGGPIWDLELAESGLLGCGLGDLRNDREVTRTDDRCVEVVGHDQLAVVAA